MTSAGDRPLRPPTGWNIITTVYSHEDGRTGHQSSAKLTAPCYERYSGSNCGASEPAVLQLADGQVWMLIRTQTLFGHAVGARQGGNGIMPVP